MRYGEAMKAMENVRPIRSFSPKMRDTNSSFLSPMELSESITKVAFVLLDNFSLMAFTASVDALVTANLVMGHDQFRIGTFGLDKMTVKSDLGIDLSTSGTLNSLDIGGTEGADKLIVCGGFRCSHVEHPVRAIVNSGV